MLDLNINTDNNFQHKEKLTEQLIKAWGMNYFYWREIMLWCTHFVFFSFHNLTPNSLQKHNNH